MTNFAKEITDSGYGKVHDTEQKELGLPKNSKKGLMLAGKALPKVIREDKICELINRFE